MSPAVRYWLVMPAAGVGRRFGSALPKQYAKLHGRSVIEWALAPFLADVHCLGVVVVTAGEDRYWPAIAARLPGLTNVAGGASRSGSVRNGLRALAGRADSQDWVLVHDAARPCVSPQEIGQLLHAAAAHPVGGILAVPAADTLKRARSDGEIITTVDREGLWRALTPQMFRLGKLIEALEQAERTGRVPTDEAQALEWLGQHPLVVPGSAANIKITGADDLLVAGAVLAARQRPTTEASVP
ncbi:MAG: 2-C-methyl-D-erythritol 4-phosphate cytidylyltransferase [Sinobacteraceae bacterium]|nr:2-C-methyl-D-erythritol 4-phosphate cytidylyltransferase [Nevskiaceae bacterium]